MTPVTSLEPEDEDGGAVERLSDLAKRLGQLPDDRLRELLAEIEGEDGNSFEE